MIDELFDDTQRRACCNQRLTVFVFISAALVASDLLMRPTGTHPTHPSISWNPKRKMYSCNSNADPEEICERNAELGEMCERNAEPEEMCESNAEPGEMCETNADPEEMCDRNAEP